MAGFECSIMRWCDGVRVDASAASGHDLRVAEDYRLVAEHGMLTARDGLRWHLIERQPGAYDWSSWRPMLDAAQAVGVQVVWDLLHFGYPEWIADAFSAELPERFAAFCEAAARVFREHSDETPWWAPVNEPSYYAWAGGHMSHMAPCARDRGDDWKRQLVRCGVVGAQALRRVDERARFLLTDPVIHVTSALDERTRADAEAGRQLMFHAWDALAGRRWEDLGGRADLLDVIGVNFYPHNQWSFDSGEHRTIARGEPSYRPFHKILLEVWERYRRPMIVSETGAEAEAGPEWLAYAWAEVEIARGAGAVIHGICLYPVLDYSGWGDGRHCRTGLIKSEPGFGERSICAAHADELKRLQAAT